MPSSVPIANTFAVVMPSHPFMAPPPGYTPPPQPSGQQTALPPAPRGPRPPASYPIFTAQVCGVRSSDIALCLLWSFETFSHLLLILTVKLRILLLLETCIISKS